MLEIASIETRRASPIVRFSCFFDLFLLAATTCVMSLRKQKTLFLSFTENEIETHLKVSSINPLK